MINIDITGPSYYHTGSLIVLLYCEPFKRIVQYSVNLCVN